MSQVAIQKWKLFFHVDNIGKRTQFSGEKRKKKTSTQLGTPLRIEVKDPGRVPDLERTTRRKNRENRKALILLLHEANRVANGRGFKLTMTGN